MEHIFICYSRTDRHYALLLKNALEKHSKIAWIDLEDLPASSSWREEIKNAITASVAFVYLVSADSLRSEYCQKEFDFSRDLNKRIFPILLPEMAGKDVSESISAFQWLRWEDFGDDFNISKLIKDIETDHEWVKFHTQLAVKTANWEIQKDTSRLLRGNELKIAEQRLASAGNKNPQPTDLLRQYILESRRNEERQRRQIIFGLSLGLIVLAALSIFAWIQRNEAKLQQTIAQSASTKAIEQEHIAIANEAEAKRQEETAIARQLAAQSDLLLSQEPKKITLAVLLSLESIKHTETAEGLNALRNGLALLPDLIAKFQIMPSSSRGNQNVVSNPVNVLKFSPDGKWLAVGTQETIVSVWDTFTWEEVLHVESATSGGVVGVVRSLSFSPDSKLLISGADAGIAQVWDISSGKEISRLLHDDQIWVVGFTSDGNRAISGAGGEIVVWDPRSGQEFYRLPAGTNVLAISTNGKLAAAAAGSNITVWDVETGEILTTKAQFTRVDKYDNLRSVSALVFSEDGSMIASAEGEGIGIWQVPRPPSIGGRILIWDPLTGKDIATMQHGDSVPALAFSQDGKKLLTGSFDGTSRVWDVLTGRPISDFSFDANVGAVAFGKNDEWIVSSSYDHTARIWDARTGDEINRLITENDTDIETIAISTNGEFVAGGNDEGVWVWKIGGQEIVKMEHGQALTISSVDYSTDGKLLVTSSWDRKVRTWDAQTGALIATVEHEKQAFLSVFNPNSKLVASADLGGQVKIWDPYTGIESFQITKFREISQILFSPDEKLLAISEGIYPRDGFQIYSFQIDQEPGVVSIWDVASGKEIAHLKHDAIVNSIAFSPDGKQILTGGKDGVARLWNIKTQTIISETRFNYFISVVAISPNGQLAAGVESCSPNGMGTASCTPILRVWDLLTDKILWDTNLNGRWIPNLLFSPNSKLLVTENNFLKSCTQKDCKNQVIVWDALSGTQISEKKYEFEFGLMVLAFNKDSTLIATGGGPLHNGWVDIWNPESGVEVSRIFYQQALSAAFSPIEDTIAIVGNQDGVAYAQVFSLETSNLVDMACSRLKRNLTEQERKDYLGNTPQKNICPNFSQQSNNDPDRPSYDPSISHDGRWVVFVSEASNLVCGSTIASSDILLYDQDNGLIQKISNPIHGQSTDGTSSSPYITSNGGYIVYESTADNLVAEDLNKFQDIFLYDVSTRKTELISVNSQNEQSNSYSQNPFVSDDGRFVIFTSSATNLVAGDNNENRDVFIRDRKTGKTRMISVPSNESSTNSNPGDPWISPDGEYVLFYSHTFNLLDDQNSTTDWYLYNQQLNTYKPIPYKWTYGVDFSFTPDGGQFGAGIQTIVGDGSFGEYELAEILVGDFKTNASKIISINSKGIYGNRDSVSPAISVDGQFVVFASEANNLVEGDTNSAWDIFLWDSQVGGIQRIIMGKDGSQSNGHSLGTDISGDGRYIIFTSTATNLVDGDFNLMRDVFIYDAQTKITKRIEPISCSQEK